MSAPGQALKTGTALGALCDFSSGSQYHGTAHLNGPSDTTQHRHTDLVSCYISISLKTSCESGRRCINSRPSKQSIVAHYQKHLIQLCSDGTGSLIDVPTFSINKSLVKCCFVYLYRSWTSLNSLTFSNFSKSHTGYSDVYCMKSWAFTSTDLNCGKARDGFC